MEELGLIFLAFLAGAYLGWKVHERIIVYAIRYKPEDIEEAIKIAKAESLQGDEEIEIEHDGKSIKTRGVELAIEHVGGHLYAYAKATNQFIAQGETLEDLLDKAHKRFPGKTFFGDVPEKEHQNS